MLLDLRSKLFEVLWKIFPALEDQLQHHLRGGSDGGRVDGRGVLALPMGSTPYIRGRIGAAKVDELPLEDLLDDLFELSEHIPLELRREIASCLGERDHPQKLVKLLLAAEERAANDDACARCKAAYVASSLFTSVPDLLRTLSGDHALVDQLLSFFERSPPQSALLTSYVVNTLSSLLRDHAAATIKKLRRRSPAVKAMTRHLSHSCVADFLLLLANGGGEGVGVLSVGGGGGGGGGGDDAGDRRKKQLEGLQVLSDGGVVAQAIEEFGGEARFLREHDDAAAAAAAPAAAAAWTTPDDAVSGAEEEAQTEKGDAPAAARTNLDEAADGTEEEAERTDETPAVQVEEKGDNDDSPDDDERSEGEQKSPPLDNGDDEDEEGDAAASADGGDAAADGGRGDVDGGDARRRRRVRAEETLDNVSLLLSGVFGIVLERERVEHVGDASTPPPRMDAAVERLHPLRNPEMVNAVLSEAVSGPGECREALRAALKMLLELVATLFCERQLYRSALGAVPPGAVDARMMDTLTRAYVPRLRDILDDMCTRARAARAAGEAPERFGDYRVKIIEVFIAMLKSPMETAVVVFQEGVHERLFELALLYRDNSIIHGLVCLAVEVSFRKARPDCARIWLREFELPRRILDALSKAEGGDEDSPPPSARRAAAAAAESASLVSALCRMALSVRRYLERNVETPAEELLGDPALARRFREFSKGELQTLLDEESQLLGGGTSAQRAMAQSRSTSACASSSGGGGGGKGVTASKARPSRSSSAASSLPSSSSSSAEDSAESGGGGGGGGGGAEGGARASTLATVATCARIGGAAGSSSLTMRGVRMTEPS